jgi:hypothetical protein
MFLFFSLQNPRQPPSLSSWDRWTGLRLILSKRDYRRLGSVFTLTNRINFFFKKLFYFKNLKSLNLPWSIVILSHKYSKYSQSVAYDNYDDFQHLNFISSQKFHLTILTIIFNDKTDPRVRYATQHAPVHHPLETCYESVQLLYGWTTTD